MRPRHEKRGASRIPTAAIDHIAGRIPVASSNLAGQQLSQRLHAPEHTVSGGAANFDAAFTHVQRVGLAVCGDQRCVQTNRASVRDACRRRGSRLRIDVHDKSRAKADDVAEQVTDFGQAAAARWLWNADRAHEREQSGIAVTFRRFHARQKRRQRDGSKRFGNVEQRLRRLRS